jgi:hypothetical protein
VPAKSSDARDGVENFLSLEKTTKMRIEQSFFAAVLLVATVFALYSTKNVIDGTHIPGYTLVDGCLMKKMRRLVSQPSCCTECEKHL